MNVSAMCMMTMTGTGVTANGVKNALTRPFFCTKAEFTQKMQSWWESCGLESKNKSQG